MTTKCGFTWRYALPLALVAWVQAGCTSVHRVGLADTAGDAAASFCSGPVHQAAMTDPANGAPAPSSAHSTERPGAGPRTGTAADEAPRSLPIDLPTALRLGNANNLEIALARERINAALARLESAEVLWLPDLAAASDYARHDGQIQRSTGEVFDAHRSSLYVRGGPVLSVDLADALYEPLVGRQFLRADEAGAEATTNQVLLRIAEAYLELLQAQASIAVAEETERNAAELARLTEEFAKQGAGLPSDAARAQADLGIRHQEAILARERVVLASAKLIQALRLDPQLRLAPQEPSVVAIELVPDERALRDLIADALESRPELTQQQAIVQATIARLREATYGPLIPSVLLSYQSGGFGGGRNDFFGNFAEREDFAASAVWELHNLGFGDRSLRRLRESELNDARLRALLIADRVAAEVVTAHEEVQSGRKQMDVTQETVGAALRSFELNMERIRGGAGLPIEALQSIQALDRARLDYLDAVIAYDRAQFRLLTALGNRPVAPPENGELVPSPAAAPPAMPGADP